MDKWKKDLHRAFAAPPPQRKREFLRRLEQRPVSVLGFLLNQTGYIRRWVWSASALIFLTAMVGAGVLSLDMLWGISALTPLLALIAVCETGRSECYEMAELEMATRFSLRSVMLARLCILGTENLALLCLLMPLGFWHSRVSHLAAGVYILTPFLLTAFLGLCILRRVRGREGVYACVGAAALISVCAGFAHISIPRIYEAELLSWWVTGALALSAGVGTQYVKIIKRTEELAWNLS